MHTGRLRKGKKKQAVEPSQRLWRENTRLKITRHQNGMGTEALNVPKHTHTNTDADEAYLKNVC